MAKHEVVIAGGGPTGLMLAGELALARVDVAIVERRTSQDLAGSRAGGLHARTLEVFDQRGIAERFLSQGRVAQVAGFSFIPLDISDFPTRHNYGLALWQNQIERVLADWVAELPVTLYRGREVTGFSQDAAGVDVALSDGASLRADFLVGCDGGRSLVRKKAGIEFPGWDASTSYLIAEVEMTEEPAWGVRRGEKGINALGKMEDGRRARVVLVEPQVDPRDEPTMDDLRRALVAVYGTDFGAREPTWLSRFSDMARQAASYRNGRVLLAGDAAHVHGPSGGQGLNLGVQDAVNLGWKLAQVVKRTSPEDLLDTYHAERHPIGARVLRLTMAQSALGRGDNATEALRETVTDLLRMDEPRRRYAATMSGLDVQYDLGKGHPLLGRRMPDLELVTPQGTRRVYALLHAARPVLINLGEPWAFYIKPWDDRVQGVDARYAGAWELPVLGSVPAPCAVLRHPLIFGLQDREEFAGDLMLGEHLPECGHEGTEPGFGHRRQELKPSQSLCEERVDPLLRGSNVEPLVQPHALGGRAEQRQQTLGQCRQQDQPIAPRGRSDPDRREPQAEARILGVAEVLFDREAPRVQRDHLRRGQVCATRRQAPCLLHPRLLDHDHRGHLGPIRRHARVPQHLRAAALRHPLRRGPLLALGIGHPDVPSKADHPVPAARRERRVALLIPEAAIGQQRHAHLLWKDLVDPVDHLGLGVELMPRELRLLDGLPDHRGAAPVAGHEAEHAGGLIVGVVVGPVQGDHDLVAVAHEERDPGRGDGPWADSRVAQQSIDLLRRGCGVLAQRRGQAQADGVDTQGGGMENAQHSIGEREHAAGVEVLAEEFFKKAMDLGGRERAEGNRGRSGLERGRHAPEATRAPGGRGSRWTTNPTGIPAEK